MLVNTLFLLRYFGHVIPSTNDHGLTDGIRIVCNPICFNLSIVAAGWFLRSIVDTGTIQAQGHSCRLFSRADPSPNFLASLLSCIASLYRVSPAPSLSPPLPYCLDRLFASISHDMRQPCHAMSLLIPLITEALSAAQEGKEDRGRHAKLARPT